MAKRRRTGESTEKRMVDVLDQLAEFEDFKKTILPALQKDIADGLSAAQIREKYLSVAQARMVMELLNMKSSAAITAARDMFDRTEGKPTDHLEITEKYKELTDEQLEATIKAKEKVLEDAKEKEVKH